MGRRERVFPVLLWKAEDEAGDFTGFVFPAHVSSVRKLNASPASDVQPAQGGAELAQHRRSTNIFPSCTPSPYVPLRVPRRLPRQLPVIICSR